MKKILTLLFLLLTIIGLSNNLSVKENLNTADEAFESKNYREALLNYETLIIKNRVMSPLLLEKTVWLANKLNDKSRSIKYLSLLYKYYPNSARKKALDEKSSELGVDSYFTEPNVWFYITWSKIRVQFWLVSVIGLGIFASISLLFWWLNWKGQKYFMGFSIFFSLALIWFYALGIFLDKPLSYVNSGDEEYHEAPSYASSVSKTEVSENELMEVLGEEGPWLQLSYGSDTLYLPIKKQPFIF